MNIEDLEEYTSSELSELISMAQTLKADKEYVAQFGWMLDTYLTEYFRVRRAERVKGARWRTPDPVDYATWYARGDVVTHEEVRYESLISFNTYPPDIEGAWRAL